MALVQCVECNKDISDQALSCPHCGIPLLVQDQNSNAPNTSAKNELFEADDHTFVLSEITSLSEVSTRQWAVMVVGIPLLILNIYAWQYFDSWMMPTVIIVASLILIGIFYTNDGRIYSTGSVREVSDSMSEIRQNYENRVGINNLVKYSQKTLFLNIEFTINPNRVASYTSFTTSDHWIYYLIGVAALTLASYTGNDIFAVGGLFIVLGYFARRGGVCIDGVGGSSEKIFTRMKDVNLIKHQLADKIAHCNA